LKKKGKEERAVSGLSLIVCAAGGKVDTKAPPPQRERGFCHTSGGALEKKKGEKC